MTKQADLPLANPDQREFFELDARKPDPQRGFPELWWKGKRPFNGVHYYPAQRKESHGDAVDGWRNQLYWGDNLQVMGHLLRHYRGAVDLVYIDPPFDSKAQYTKTVKLRGKSAKGTASAFEEKQYSDMWVNDEYLQFMFERLILLRELLASTGSIYLHCDYHQSHRLRCLLDEVFGSESFRSEIVWKRTSAHANSSGYGVVHDTILFYTKSGSYTWNAPIADYEEWYVERYYRYEDTDGRRFKSGDLSAVGLSGGGYDYEWKGVSRMWRCPRTTMERLESEGRIYYTKNGIPRYKQFLDEMEGRPVQSLWDDIQPVVSWSTEQTAYPTQKPERLAQRIIEASSNEGDLVLDSFLGSGTTAFVAQRLGRRFIGSDINQGAIQTTIARLARAHELAGGEATTSRFKRSGFDVHAVNHYDIFRNESEAQALLLEALGVRPTPGPGLWHGELGEGNDTRLVRVMPVNRIATKADLAPIIQNLDYQELARRRAESPRKPIEKITLLCMGHEPGLGAELVQEMRKSLNDPGCKVDLEVVDILREKDHLQFKRDSEAHIAVRKQRLVIERFYPMNLLQKLSMEKTSVSDWRELVDSVLIDFNYDGAVLRPTVVDMPAGNELVAGEYDIPSDAGTIRVKITDVLADGFETSVESGRA